MASGRAVAGRRASDVTRREQTWFVPDLVPAETLTFVTGSPSTGKSTFGAWLCSQASRPAILPGFEESVETALLPRLVAAGVRLEACLLLDSKPWCLPVDLRPLTEALQAWQCDFLWIDPIDSYIGDCPENDGQPVRIALEAFCRLARDVPCAIVSARHPGKDPTNICPGSRQWRAVPRQILSLTYDAGPPERRLLRLAKDPFSRGLGPREFTLAGEHGQPKVFNYGDVVGAGEAAVMEVTDVIGRWKIDQATDLLRALLGTGEAEAAWIFKCGDAEKLNDDVLRRAAKRLGIVTRREGNGREHKSFWSLPAAPDSADSVR